MLLNFSDIFNRYNKLKPIKGIVHIGAHHGNESKEYQAHKIDNVVWFEALHKTFVELKKNVGSLPSNITFNVALSEVDGRSNFYVTDNGRGNNGSSSILQLGKHAIHYPHVKVREVVDVEVSRFDTLVAKKQLDMSKYNFLNIDVQGAELHVIKGIGKFLDGFDYIIAEVNEAELYKGGALLDELNAYLNDRGFTLKDKSMTKYEWGDALFVKDYIEVDSNI